MKYSFTVNTMLKGLDYQKAMQAFESDLKQCKTAAEVVACIANYRRLGYKPMFSQVVYPHFGIVTDTTRATAPAVIESAPVFEIDYDRLADAMLKRSVAPEPVKTTRRK